MKKKSLLTIIFSLCLISLSSCSFLQPEFEVMASISATPSDTVFVNEELMLRGNVAVNRASDEWELVFSAWSYQGPNFDVQATFEELDELNRRFIANEAGNYLITFEGRVEWDDGRRNTATESFTTTRRIVVLAENGDPNLGAPAIDLLLPDQSHNYTTAPLEFRYNVKYPDESRYDVQLLLNGVPFQTFTSVYRGDSSFSIDCLDPGSYGLRAQLLVFGLEEVSGDFATFTVGPDVCGPPVSSSCGKLDACNFQESYISGLGCVIPEDLPSQSDNLLSSPGFEQGEFVVGQVPGIAGVWQGDRAQMVSFDEAVADYHSLDPLEGSRMLKFEASAPSQASSSTVLAQVFQLYQLSQAQRNALAVGDSLLAIYTIYVNRVQGDNETDTQFFIDWGAYDGSTADYLDKYRNAGEIAGSRNKVHLLSDGCVDTWEQISDTLLIPQGTFYLGLEAGVFENVLNEDGYEAEFDGHYMDAASLRIIQ